MIKLKIDKYLDSHEITRYELAKRTGIRFQIIDNYYKNKVVRYDSYVLDRICDALGCDISEIIEYVSPDSANVDDYYLYPSSIVKISEETVETVNGKVTVMVQEMVTDRVFLRFVWQDMLVIIFGSKEDVYAELVSRLDFMDVE